MKVAKVSPCQAMGLGITSRALVSGGAGRQQRGGRPGTGDPGRLPQNTYWHNSDDTNSYHNYGHFTDYKVILIHQFL